MSAAQWCNYFTSTGMPSGLSAPKWRTVHRIILPTHQNHQCFWRIFYTGWRTVRSPLADCPQYTYANPPETTTSLEQFLILPTDCPAPLGGPSAVHVFNPPETATSLDKILDSTADCMRPSGGPSAVQSCAPPPETSFLDKLQVSTADRPLPYSGLSADNSAKPPETTSSLDET